MQSTISYHPQINLLTSVVQQNRKPAEALPEFDEHRISKCLVYVWPNDDFLYCKAIAPSPRCYKVLFAVTTSSAVPRSRCFHAGMDKVFYLAMKIARCKGVDKAELFAGEVIGVRDHLLRKTGTQIWGDRLIEGKITEWDSGKHLTIIRGGPLT